MRQTFAPILDLLDEGLRLYRDNFSRFLLLVAVAALPLGLSAAAVFLAFDWLQPGFGLLIVLFATILGTPLSLYVMGALSRAATMAVAGQPVRLRRALAIRPLRIIGMGCYGSFFLLVAGTAVSMVSTACFCVVYMVIGVGMVAFAAGSAGAGPLGGAVAGLAFGVSILVFIAVYAASLVVNGAVYGSAVYAVQPFVQDDLRFGASMGRSLDLVGYKLGQNLLAFLSASLVFGAVALASTLAIGLLLPLPALYLLGAESPVAQAITAAAWVAGVAVAAPLLPIWMALLYQRRRTARDGADLAAQIGALGWDGPAVLG